MGERRRREGFVRHVAFIGLSLILPSFISGSCAGLERRSAAGPGSGSSTTEVRAHRTNGSSAADGMSVYEFAAVNPTADAADALLQGAVLDFTWSQLEPERGRYNWSAVVAEMRPWVEAGKGVILRVVTSGESGWNPSEGEATPAWVYQEGVPHVTEADGSVIPVYWNRRFLQLYALFIHALGARFGGNLAIRMVEMGIGMGGETIVDQEEDSKVRDEIWASTGYSDRVWLRTIQTIAADYSSAFRGTPLVALIDSSFLQSSARYYDSLVAWLSSHGYERQYDGLTSDSAMSPYPDGLDPTVVEQLSPVSKTPGQCLSTEIHIAAKDLHAEVLVLYASDLSLFTQVANGQPGECG
jgi:hypothetical protein